MRRDPRIIAGPLLTVRIPRSRPQDLTVYSYSLSLAVIEYQTAILRSDFDEAATILDRVPAEQRNRIARFLESQGQEKLALQVSTDPDHRFDLAVGMDDFDTALEIARNAPGAGTAVAGGESRWRTIGDAALSKWNLPLAEECFTRAEDLPALLLLATTKSDATLLSKLAEQAAARGATNIAFAARLQLGDVHGCIELLASADRLPEAAIFARTYAPSAVSGIVKRWKASVGGKSKRPKQRAIAASIADPEVDEEAFEEGWADALSLEREAPAA